MQNYLYKFMEYIVSDEFDKHLDKIGPYIYKTPVLKSEWLNRMAGCKLWFKCENLQAIGAFKIRGAMQAALTIKAAGGALTLATHSSGNHAQAVAYAAHTLGGKAYIVMPQNAPKVKVRGVESFGGIVTFCKPTLFDRENELQKIVSNTGATVIHPYNDVSVIEGQGTCAWEFLHQLESTPDAIFAPVGGGGLLSGTALAAGKYSSQVKVFGAEPSGADDAFRSFTSGVLVTHHEPETIADGLLTTLGELPFRIIRQKVEDIITADDTDIKHAMKLIISHLRILVEPSAAVPLAVVFKEQKRFSGKNIGIILSGGNVDLERLPDLLDI